MTDLFKNFKSSYWNYYLELEEQMEESKKYVEFDEANHKTYSRNYLMLFQTVCSEIDVVGKEIAGYFDSTVKDEDSPKINRWWYGVQNNLSDVDREIEFAGSYLVRPWHKYRVVKKISQRNTEKGLVDVTNYNLQKKTDGIKFETPKWWNAYNKVKHKRLDADEDGVNFKKANLLNLSNAFAALYLLEFEFMKKIGSLDDRIRCGESSLFGSGDLEKNFINGLFVDDAAETLTLVGR